MAHLKLLTMILSTAFLMGCDVGDFCDVWQGPKIFQHETAVQIVKTDREDAEKIRVEDDYGLKNCRG